MSPPLPSKNQLTPSSKKRRPTSHSGLIVVLAVIAALGAFLIARDILTRRAVARVSLDFMNQEKSIEDWQRDGFLHAGVDSSGTLTVNEETWKKMSRDQRYAVASLLRSHYSKISAGGFSRLTLRGDVSGNVLASVALQPKD